MVAYESYIFLMFLILGEGVDISRSQKWVVHCTYFFILRIGLYRHQLEDLAWMMIMLMFVIAFSLLSNMLVSKNQCLSTELRVLVEFIFSGRLGANILPWYRVKRFHGAELWANDRKDENSQSGDASMWAYRIVYVSYSCLFRMGFMCLFYDWFRFV